MEDHEQAKRKKENLKVHPREKTNILSHLFFCWELPIILKGWKTEITEDDLYAPLEKYDSKVLGDKLEKLWQGEEYFHKKPSLARVLVKLFGMEFAVYGIVYFPMELAYAILQPYCLRKILDYFTPNQQELTRKEALIYAGLLALLSFIRVFIYHIFTFACSVVGMRIRLACSSLIYRRCLNLTKISSTKITTGHIVNLLSNDVTRFDQALPALHFLWIGPLELILGTYYIDVTFGHSSAVGVSVIFIFLLIQVFLFKRMVSNRRNVAVKTDHRIRLMNDVICGIQAIKMYTWEKPYYTLTEAARKSEMKEVSAANHLRLFSNAFKIYISKICIFLCAIPAILTGQPLTSQYIFGLSSIYETFKSSCVVMLPIAAAMFSETITTIQRIQEFLLCDYQKSGNYGENITPHALKYNDKDKVQIAGVRLKNVTFKWDGCANSVLQEVNFKAEQGELIGVIGMAGSGKSTLLQVILKEVPIFKGQLEIEGTLSYASQDSWIFSSSIKQNILFGEVFVLDKYLKVIKVCALERDLTLMPHGDQTLVGERGIMLSGGQKARINLARAIYKDADIYLLDDPLSAVDAHVGRHIFDQCILDYLKGKCVILVTHQVHYLQRATRVYQLECGMVGEVALRGSFAEMKSCGEETPTMSLQKHDLQSESKEHRSLGTTNKKIYLGFCKAAGHWSITCLVLVVFLLSQFFVSAEDVYLTFWVNLKQGLITVDGEIGNFFTPNNFLYVYIVITLGALLVTHLAAIIFTFHCTSASKNLHGNMLRRILYSSMSFFNQHHSGRILNRFSKDMGTIDEILPLHLMNGITVVFTTAAVLLIVVVINYWMVIPTVILIAITLFFGKAFQPCNRNIKRTEGITRSSVFTHVSASLQGLTTIRAMKVQNKLAQEFDDYQNLHSSAFYMFTATFGAFGFWTDFIAVIYTVLLIFSFFFLESKTSTGNVGLAITQSFGLLLMVQYAMKTWGELDANMTSVERVVEYAELDPEPDTGADSPSEAWPEAGNVLFNSVSLQYSQDDPPVLRNVAFRISSGEKVGIVGRTGAGKTSLLSVLFRLFPFQGSVVIDGIDTKTVPLNALRAKISIIPQEPVLFLGTLRKNIDPFDEFNDHQIWEALEQLELKEMIANLPSGLDSSVSERGSNFSVGQRQLFCLIRAMLKNNKIIVLDEATANVDLETDRLIQSAIRKKFKVCTVLTIAHRLNTVMDSDKILVMDGGRVVEFGPPHELLRRKEGFFYGYLNQHKHSS